MAPAREAPPAKAGKVRRLSVLSRIHGNTLRLDPNQGTWVMGMLWFDSDLGFANVERLAREKLLVIPRFRSAMKLNWMGKERWVELPVEQLDMAYHLVRVAEPLSKAQVYERYISDIYASFKLDMDKPLWRLVWFEDIEGQRMLLTQVSHAVGDGVSIVEVLLRMLDAEEPDSGDEAGKASGRTAPAEPMPALADAAAAAKPKQQQPGPKPKRKVKASFGPLNKARIFLGGCMSPLTAAFGSADSPSPLRRRNLLEPSTKKSTAFTEQIDLAAIKQIKARYPGATVNDICVSLLNLTLQAYLSEVAETHPEPATRASAKRMLSGKGLMRSSFPINARKAGAATAFRDHSPHNKLALGMLAFNFNYKSRSQLVWSFKRTMDRIKLSPEPFVQQKLGNLLAAILSKKAMVNLLMKLGAQTHCMLSNVQGPPEKVELLGHTVEDITFALFSGCGLYLGLLSYAGKISVCICLDSELGDAQNIAKHWKKEFDELYKEVMAHDGAVPRHLGCSGCLDRL